MTEGKIGLVYIPGRGSGASTSTPFLRRWFVNENKREERETRELHAELSEKPNPYTNVEIGTPIYEDFCSYLDGDVLTAFSQILDAIIQDERYL
ncbi:MAG: hypothetical protein JOZ43_03695, partial [Acidobacteriales bacterium]|nr:hypothetical protein [Terriglobales bacterium]